MSDSTDRLAEAARAFLPCCYPCGGTGTLLSDFSFDNDGPASCSCTELRAALAAHDAERERRADGCQLCEQEAELAPGTFTPHEHAQRGPEWTAKLETALQWLALEVGKAARIDGVVTGEELVAHVAAQADKLARIEEVMARRGSSDLAKAGDADVLRKIRSILEDPFAANECKAGHHDPDSGGRCRWCAAILEEP